MRTSTFRLRPAAPGDEHALALVGQATFLETFAGMIDGPDVVAHCRTQHAPDRYAEWLARPEAYASLAEVEPGGAPIGYVLLAEPQSPISDARPTDIELKRIYLLSRYHGAGIGAALMDDAIRTARDRGHTRMLLGVYAGNQRALSFYARCGFERVGERRFRVGGNEYEDIVHALEL
jgi:GNAT superfamily N-acetyltransferase